MAAILKIYIYFSSWPFTIIGMWLCVGLLNFIWMGRSVTDLSRHIDFPRWRPRRRKSTSCFPFGDVTHLRRSKTIRVPNFAKMSLSTAEILLLPVYKNKRPPSWKSTSTFHFDQFTIIGIWLCVGLPNFIWMGRSARRWQIYVIISIFKIAIAASEICFRFPVCRRHALEIVKDYPCTKFR